MSAAIDIKRQPSIRSGDRAERATGTARAQARAQYYERWYEPIWADMDQNGHMRHTAYLDYATQARMSCFADNGASISEFCGLGCGPILTFETARYLREVRPGDMICVRVELLGESRDGKHFAMRTTIVRDDGDTAAVIDIQGAWMDTAGRRLMPAPAPVAHAMARMPLSVDYAEIVTHRSMPT